MSEHKQNNLALNLELKQKVDQSQVNFASKDDVAIKPKDFW